MKRFLVGVAVLAALVVVPRMLRNPAPTLVGLWLATPPARELSDELRFYYFHEGDKGLYRYGKAGYNNTASFDWRVSGDELTLATCDPARLEVFDWLARETRRQILLVVATAAEIERAIKRLYELRVVPAVTGAAVPGLGCSAAVVLVRANKVASSAGMGRAKR